MRLRLFCLLAAAMLAAACVTTDAGRAVDDCAEAEGRRYVQGGAHCLAVKSFAAEGAVNTLVVVLHGDLSRGGPADYIFPLARAATGAGTAGIALMRPGYTGDGRRSTGRASREQSRDEKYNLAEIDSVGVAIARLKALYGADRLILLGHSGGAVIAGVLLGRRPDLVDAVLLISCPCNVRRWRDSRGLRHWPHAESPHDWLDRASPRTRIVAITGSDDRNTAPSLAGDYVAAAQAHGLEADFTVVRYAGHGMGTRLQGAASSALRELLDR